MLCKLAWGNVRRAGKDYLVYLLTLTLSVTVFYAFNTISLQVETVNIDRDDVASLLGSLISGLTVFLAVVMGFLMVYANNFIMKRRKKEFGLYQVLGMSRGQVARVMALETAMVSAAALVLGIVLGVALSQLMVFFTAALFKTQIANFRFIFSPSALLLTVGCLVAIFLVTLVFNLRVVARSRIVDLMSAGRQNEQIRVRNPWLSAIVFVVGAVLIGVAYARLLHDGFPMEDSAYTDFGITTAMVVAGTILFFFGFSGFLLKVLQGVRGLYWRGLNMFTMRQLAAKVNTVSFSMAIIAMILFLAITSVTAGMSIANVMSENLEMGTPADYTRLFYYYSENVAESQNSYIDTAESEAPGSYDGLRDDAGNPVRAATATRPVDIMAASKEDVLTVDEDGTQEPFDLASIARDYVQLDTYDSRPLGSDPTDPDQAYVTLYDFADAGGTDLPKGVESSGNLSLAVVEESEYNRFREFMGLDPVDVGEDGYLVTCNVGNSITSVYTAALKAGYSFDLGGRELHPVQEEVLTDAASFANSQGGSNAGTLVVPDGTPQAGNMPLYISYLLLDYADGVDTEQGDAYIKRERSYEYGDAGLEDGVQVGYWGAEATRTEIYEGSDSLNGLISYLAIYIGFVLVVACAAILTIQQLSGVADSAASYRILSELGTPTSQIAHSVLAQQTVFFAFPLVMGIAHSIVALRVIIDLVELFGGLSIGGMVGLTCVIFALAYGGYFLVTYLMSRSLVRDAIRVRHAE